MMATTTTDHISAVLARLRDKKLLTNDDWQATRLAGDGSARGFIRLRRADGASLLLILPPDGVEDDDNSKNLAEAAAAWHIGRHLRQCNVPVPQIMGYDPEAGILLVEDLGNTLLHAVVLRSESLHEIHGLYRAAIDVLVHMQTAGCDGFNTDWCHDTRRYDRQLMLSRESGYFQQAFCRDYLGINRFAVGLQSEFIRLADRAAEQPAAFFLHRDFQSRNLMLLHGKIRVIDFQGGRLGPLGYDLASLLIDPYVALSPASQAELLDYYLSQLSLQVTINADQFRQGYAFLALQRNLQILGAFAFLSRVGRKPFFQHYIPPALCSLHEHLAKSNNADYPCLRALADDCLTRMMDSQKIHH